MALRLFGDKTPMPRAELMRYAPELVVYHEAGWMLASVAIGQRSQCYLISLPTAGVTSQLVNADQPGVVADLVLALASGQIRAVPHA